MEEKKKFEINDDMLEKVSGGGNFPSNVEHRVGEVVKIRCPGGCGGRNGSTGVITEIVDEYNAKIKMDCCGREFVLPRRESGTGQHSIIKTL